MNLGAVMSLDYRVAEQRRQLQHALGNLRPLKRKARPYIESGDEIPLELLSGLLEAIIRKYDLETKFSIEPTRSGTMYVCTSFSGGKGYGTVYGCCYYEMVAKWVIVMSERAVSGRLPLRKGRL